MEHYKIRGIERRVLNRIPTKAVSQFGALADMCSAPMLLIVSVKQNVKNKLTAYHFSTAQMSLIKFSGGI